MVLSHNNGCLLIAVILMAVLPLGTLDGSIGCLLPIPEKVYRRLSMLQIKMTQGLKHLAGLNPKAFR
jgi:hypothetical protein